MEGCGAIALGGFPVALDSCVVEVELEI